MTVGQLIKLIPSQTFQELAVETKVDAQVKKLSGEVIFKLILFSMLNSEKLSLRVMETFLYSAQFKAFTQYDILDGKYNSIRDRICTINSEYFERLFTSVFTTFNHVLGEQRSLSKADSTYVSIAAKLLSEGIEMGGGNRYLKYSINIKGSIPSSIKIFTDQSHASEELALPELIDDSDCIRGNVVVFDMGVRSRKSFDKITTSGKFFITRSELHIKCNEAVDNVVPPKAPGSTVTIYNDQTATLSSKQSKKTEYRYRIIKGIIDKSGKPICFVTNMLDENPYTVAKLYKQRWEIEVFFKFIKQHLNTSHLVSRNSNGIKVMIYMTMILATLIIAYKKLNFMKGFKIPKLKFELELDNEIMKEIVILCGGDPTKAPHLFHSQ